MKVVAVGFVGVCRAWSVEWAAAVTVWNEYDPIQPILIPSMFFDAEIWGFDYVNPTQQMGEIDKEYIERSYALMI